MAGSLEMGGRKERSKAPSNDPACGLNKIASNQCFDSHSLKAGGALPGKLLKAQQFKHFFFPFLPAVPFLHLTLKHINSSLERSKTKHLLPSNPAASVLECYINQWLCSASLTVRHRGLCGQFWPAARQCN